LPRPFAASGFAPDLAPQDLLFLSRAASPAAAFGGSGSIGEGGRPQREYQAAARRGDRRKLAQSTAVAAEAGLAGAAAIRTKGDALDPYRACIGLRRSRRVEASAGVRAHGPCGTHPRGPQSSRSKPTAASSLRAVIVATGGLPDDLRALTGSRHVRADDAVGTPDWSPEEIPSSAAVRRTGKRASRTARLPDLRARAARRRALG